jgi:ABC-type nitrate/sulfonate/bicarbonate transport system substrate-binding protein
MSHTRRRALGAAVLLAAAVAWAPRPGAQGTPTSVTIAVSSTSFVLGGVRIAEHAGLFDKHGLSPRIIVMDSGNAALSALLSRSAQFAVSGPSEALAARARGQDIVIVANLYRGLSASLILSKAAAARLAVSDRAPVGERLRALNGMTIAVPSATSAFVGPLRNAIAAAGAQVRFTYVAQATMGAALETRAIDAMMASGPFSGAPILKGTGVLWIDGPRGELPADVSPASSSCLQTTSAYAAANRETVRRLRAVLDDVAHLVRGNPEEARRALAKGFAQVGAASIDLALEQESANWTFPVLSEADIAQEIKLLRAAGAPLPGLDRIAPASVLLPR